MNNLIVLGLNSPQCDAAAHDTDHVDTPSKDTPSKATIVSPDISRVKFVGSLLSSLTASFTLSVLPSHAKDTSSDKGTKSDPKYTSCVSACMYDCTKPKGEEQKGRAECIPECKKKCATSSDQLLLGTPKKD
ncbi:hypothetical protein TrCOL_g6317 [Triparma columacea]|uniref:Uncharacterized protein n=1 Tax=Triparma columacea TaxID=722753 RepID=A0A9W7GFB4_9STRA|nr:hypothetical protein TrCOL_g6317 [Triparma columacea]